MQFLFVPLCRWHADYAWSSWQDIKSRRDLIQIQRLEKAAMALREKIPSSGAVMRVRTHLTLSTTS